MTNAPARSNVSSSHHFNPVIIREYDIRGEAGTTLHDTDAYHLGRAFGTFVTARGGSRVCVGFDGRVSSPSFSRALIDGLSECGLIVDVIGLGPTPMLYFAVKDSDADAGVMVTGSHNPGKDNGFKMMLQTGPVYGAMIKEIAAIAASGAYVSGAGSVREIEVKERYVARLLKDLSPLPRPYKIAWDTGNGAAGEIVKMLTQKLPGEHILLFNDIDGTFPNHHPDPTVDKNLKDLQETVLREKCDFGIAMDGDGDRIGTVDERGAIIRSDILLTIYAKEVLEQFPGAPIIADVKCSQVLFDAIAEMGGQPIIWKTGHSLIKAKMAETKSPLAGELSGHIFFADKYYGFDDALYCSIRLMNAMAAAKGGALSSLIAHLPAQVNTPELRIEVPESEKFSIVPGIVRRLREENVPGTSISDLDGIRVTTPTGWWLLRPSNTQSALVARVEAPTTAALEKLKGMLISELAKSGYTVTL